MMRKHHFFYIKSYKKTCKPLLQLSYNHDASKSILRGVKKVLDIKYHKAHKACLRAC